ncbi:hypothetical protein Psi02_77380 [Planotetraspora silvatica]|uniref:Transposase IS701-like DDE domain-containing protein n=1 Tax=Planotetraspora silvatica TaxID=234614 RepID=A0A8J3UZJ1_9ACTN|nr:transposase [Planotetraspora silvatica]GII51314.1 hypothetical protein Psi02_77380 [Planotetraspora silvatica]
MSRRERRRAAINVVYCSFATRAGHALVGARLYLPAEQAADAARRRQARVPEEVKFATKPELGRQILAGLHAEGRLPPWVTGDEVYGRDPGLRTWLEQAGTGYVLGISKSTPVAFTKTRQARADTALKMLIASDWVIDSCGGRLQRRTPLRLGLDRHRRPTPSPADPPQPGPQCQRRP